MRIFGDFSWTSLQRSGASVHCFSVWDLGGFGFAATSLWGLCYPHGAQRVQESRSLCLYISRGHFSRSQPFIRSFTLAWSKKCTVTTMIQMSLELWPKHCTSVGGPIKVLHSSLWELQPPVKDCSLEQHILKSGLALPRVDFLTFSLSLVLRRLLQESMSVHLSIKMRHGKVKKTPIHCWSTA